MNPGPNKFNIGDKVFVVNWDAQYSQIASSQGVFWKDDERVAQYSGVDFFNRTIRQELTAAGKPWKKPYNAPVIRREYPWKNFKWEVVDFKPHPSYGEFLYEEHHRKVYGYGKYDTPYVYLLKSLDHSAHGFNESFPCVCEIGEEGLSLLTPEQYADAQFNALKDSHIAQWSSARANKEKDKFPEELLKKVYDKDDNVLFGSSVVKGKVYYTYIPGEYMDTGRPYIIFTGISYDGKGNADLPKDALIMPFKKLPEMFTENQFA